MADLTLLLDAIQRSEPSAADALLTQVYAELRQLARAKMAREQPGHTLLQRRGCTGESRVMDPPSIDRPLLYETP